MSETSVGLILVFLSVFLFIGAAAMKSDTLLFPAGFLITYGCVTLTRGLQRDR